MCSANGRNSRSVSRSTSGRYTSRRWSSKTWSKFPTGWWKCTPNTNRTGSIRWAHRGTAPLSRLADTAPARSRPQDRCSAPGRGAPADPLRGWRRPFRRARSRAPPSAARSATRASDVIEEPATGGEHAQRVALELEQLTGPRQRASIVGMSQPLADEARDGVVRRSQNGAIDVPNRPWVCGEERAPLTLEHAVQLGRQPI